MSPSPSVSRQYAIAPLEAASKSQSLIVSGSRKSYGSTKHARRSIISRRLGYAHFYPPPQPLSSEYMQKQSKRRFWQYTFQRLLLVATWIFFGVVTRGMANKYDLNARARLYIATGLTFLLLVGLIYSSVQWAAEVREEHWANLAAKLGVELFRLEGMYDRSQQEEHVPVNPDFGGQVPFVDSAEGSNVFNALEAQYLSSYHRKYHDLPLYGKDNQYLRDHLEDIESGLRNLDVIEEHAESARRRNDILDLNFMGATGKAFLATVKSVKDSHPGS
ncbi:hypothetical protein D9758_013098 [Tetrapyrgos nigripes]|uniref:Uncharacterized protein n=1 Tax=Tetrapyrgos nigripes TaxID=182062 RepID=A0A8H5C9V6_9AGAR|nr:hypothetical protein D9758_013098 [Tetrapyrgos nigripes]